MSRALSIWRGPEESGLVDEERGSVKPRVARAPGAERRREGPDCNPATRTPESWLSRCAWQTPAQVTYEAPCGQADHILLPAPFLEMVWTPVPGGTDRGPGGSEPPAWFLGG